MDPRRPVTNESRQSHSVSSSLNACIETMTKSPELDSPVQLPCIYWSGQSAWLGTRMQDVCAASMRHIVLPIRLAEHWSPRSPIARSSFSMGVLPIGLREIWEPSTNVLSVPETRTFTPQECYRAPYGQHYFHSSRRALFTARLFKRGPARSNGASIFYFLGTNLFYTVATVVYIQVGNLS